MQLSTQKGQVNYSDALNNPNNFEQAMKMASFLAGSRLIPKEFRGEPQNCLIALYMSATLKVSPFEVMKGTYIVNGTPAFSAKFAIALANRSGVFDTRLMGETTGKNSDDLKVRVHTSIKDEKISCSFSLAQAKKAGWYDKPTSYWKVDPEQMCFYRASLALIRRYAPEILMGMYVEEELEDTVQTVQSCQNEAIAAMNNQYKPITNHNQNV